MWSALTSRRRRGLCLAEGFTTTSKRLTSSAGRLALELLTCSQGLVQHLSPYLCPPPPSVLFSTEAVID